MAIVIQQEKNGASWLFICSLLFVLIMIGVASFYLFFVAPEKVEEKLASPQMREISDLKEIDFDPNKLIQDQSFTKLSPSLKLNVPDSSSLGRANPFLP